MHRSLRLGRCRKNLPLYVAGEPLADKTLHLLVRDILNREWDPIGVEDHVDDEYDNYAARVATMLAAGDDSSAIGRYLNRLLSTSMGLTPNPPLCDHVARALANAYHAHILCPELKAVLAAELENGNAIAESSVGWPRESSVFIRLQRPVTATTPAGIDCRDVNDPHYWDAELYHHRSGHILAW